MKTGISPVGELEALRPDELLRDLRELLVRPVTQEQFAFIEIHPLIRDLQTYDNLVPVCFSPVPQNTPNP